jgi:hypothetical protein
MTGFDGGHAHALGVGRTADVSLEIHSYFCGRSFDNKPSLITFERNPMTNSEPINKTTGELYGGFTNMTGWKDRLTNSLMDGSSR